MKDLKVLSKLSSKVRRKTVFYSEQAFNDTFVFGKQIQSDSFFLLDPKGNGTSFSLNLLDLCVTSAYMRRRNSLTKQNCYVKDVCKNLVSFYCNTFALKKYNKHKGRSLFAYVNRLPCTLTFLHSLERVTQEKDLGEPIAWFNKGYKIESTRDRRAFFLQHLLEPAEILSSLMCSKNCLWKQDLRLNDIAYDRMSSLRFSNTFSQGGENHKMIRPLLDFKRETITMVCKDLRMPVYPDQSNRSVQYSRNRIRKQIIPGIKYFLNPQVEESLFKLAERLNEEQFFLYSVIRNTSGDVCL